MRITFVIPFVNLTGGIRAVLDFANVLESRGHMVAVVYPAWPYRFHVTRRQQLQECRRTLSHPAGVVWFDARIPVRRVPLIRNTFLPRADVVVATSWPTAYDVARLSASRGQKVQLIMHDESDTGPPGRVRRTFTLPLRRLTISHAIARELDALGCSISEIVPCGVNPRVFFRDGAQERDTVMMVYHPEPRKGAHVGIAAIERIRRRLPSVRARICGTVPVEGLPDWIDVTWCPADETLRRMYSTSTCFLYPSLYEGFGLPPLEAMACGCPVVTTAVGAIPEYASDRRDALLVPPDDADALADAACELLANPALCQQLSQQGLHTAEQHSTDRAGTMFEQALLRSVGRATAAA